MGHMPRRTSTSRRDRDVRCFGHREWACTAKLLERIFAPFFTTKEASKGTGWDFRQYSTTVRRDKGRRSASTSRDGRAPNRRSSAPPTLEGSEAGSPRRGPGAGPERHEVNPASVRVQRPRTAECG